MPTIIITLPLPAKALSPNQSRNVHWSAKSRAVKKARGDAYIATRAADDMRVHWVKPIAQATFFFRTKHKHDDDNLVGWLKAYRDGIADGLGINDRDLSFLPNIEAVDKSDPRLVVTIQEVEG